MIIVEARTGKDKLSEREKNQQKLNGNVTKAWVSEAWGDRVEELLEEEGEILDNGYSETLKETNMLVHQKGWKNHQKI